MADGSPTIGALLEFWFGAPGTPGCDEPRALWFKPDPAFDAALGARFGAAYRDAEASRCDHWCDSAAGALALLLLLDQVPRNLNRGRAAAFACDAKACATARAALARGFDREVPAVRRLFFYLPFEHSEALADQELSLALVAALPPGPYREQSLAAARLHPAIIARFGRFPHRNRALGRASTAAEEAFLKEPDSSF